MKSTIVAILMMALSLGATYVYAATPNTGQHIHIEISNMPVDGHPIPRSMYTFNLIIKLHKEVAPAVTKYVRLDDYSTPRAQLPVAIGPCDDCSISMPFSVDFASWTQGRHELRWHVDIPKNNDGKRQYTTSRSQVCLGSCLPNVSQRVTPFQGGGSWYDHYATIYVLSPETDIKPGGSVRIRAAQDADKVCALLNPDIHNDNSGTILGCWADTKEHVVPIPSTALVGDKLLLMAIETNGSSTGNVGNIRFLLGDGSDQAFANYEYQSWWAKGGMVLP